jgi:nucleotide-binding universal stress UspA family protein
MYRKILVPLDGSDLAECVLPHVESIARGCGAKGIILLRVIEPYEITPSSGDVGAVSEEEIKRANVRRRTEIEEYLAGVESRICSAGVDIQKEVLIGKAAESIIDYANGSEIDLVTIATHGRSGVSRWVWGSIADRILRSACVPVLMIRPPGCIAGF